MPIDALDVLTDVAVVAADVEAAEAAPVAETPVHPLSYYLAGPYADIAQRIIDLEMSVAALKGAQ